MYRDKLKKGKTLKNGKTHPWKAHTGTTAQQQEGLNKGEIVAPFSSTMGVRKNG